ncbi:tape measure protein [Sanguibacter sp. HDW7]|uniref:tape measure protein n=1 Tax=Sanguibacter sp. HDW7 TaxID=2714931 RepID=UPI00140D17BA|nr:tape measure protein [Sanguibacter sp. HDW7]QIK82392.1 tape measure protein [Sanguibacter sp. HDW7]
MAERNISVRLRAEVGEFRRALGQGVLSLKEMQAAATKTESVMDKAKSEMATAAKRVEAAEKQLARTQKDSTKTASQKAAAEVKLQHALDKHKKATDAAVQAEAKHRVSLQQVAKAQETAATAAGRTAQRIKDNTDAYQKAGGVLAAAGAATTGLVVATVKTGVAYNSLQQSSRAALKTMLGGAEAVNAQMGELDKFAKTSPFSKQTFISAQQQMLAFGIESKKVIPYLSAINDATAAAGGNSQMLGELAFVMAQISAAGKITGQDLIQFGQRGVNAAELIGSQMGLTGAEIKAHITKGTLGADVALDALAAGMSEKFAGASANVKQTWDGATDRVRSAIRDISALLAAPLVDPESGGAAVGWANGLADALRNVEGTLKDLPGPVRVVASALVAAGGGATTLAGGLLIALPRIIATREAMQALAASGSKIPGVLKGAGKASLILGGLAIGTAAANALGNWVTSVGVAAPAVDALTDALLGLEKAGDGRFVQSLISGDTGNASWTDWATPAIAQADAIRGIADAMRELKGASEEGWWEKWGAGARKSGKGNVFSLFVDTAAFKQAEESIKNLDSAMAQVVASGDAEALASAQALIEAEAATLGLTLDEAATRWMPQYTEALAGVGAESATAGAATLQAALDAEEAAKAAKAAQEELQRAFDDFSSLYGDAAGAFIDLGGAYDAVVEKNKALAESTAAATKDSKDSWEDFYDGVSVSASDYIAELESQVKAQGEWKANMVTLAGKVSEETLAELANLGPAGAPLVAELVNATDKELSRLDLATVAKNETDAFVQAIAGAQENIPMLKVLADMGLARTALDHFVDEAQRRQIKINITANGGGGGGKGAATAKADGGSVVGPGTGTSDSIPAWLSNGEHVLTASDVAKAGGQGAVYRMRGLIQAGALRFASGGSVGIAGSGASAVERAAAAVRRERAQVKSAEKAVERAQSASTRASRASADTSSKDKSAKKRAQQAARDAQDAVKAARKALAKEKADLKAAEKAYEQAKAARKAENDRRADVRDRRADHATDERRGTTRDQVNSGLTGGLSAVDSALDLASSGTLSKEKSAALRKAAQQAEKDLTKQYALLEKQNAEIEKSKALLSDVKGMHDQVAQSIMGEVKLTDTLSAATSKVEQHSNGRGDIWYSESTSGGGTSAGAIRAYVQDKLTKVRAFNGRLNALRLRGAPNALLQEVLSAGIEGGTQLANALLSASGSDWQAITSTWAALESESSRTGDIATQSAFGTTTDVVQKQLERQTAAAEDTKAAIDRVAQILSEATGIALTGYATGGWITGGVRGRDSVPIMTMPGEHVTNAVSARYNANLLERINATPGPVAAPLVAVPVAAGVGASSAPVYVTIPDIYVRNPITGEDVRAVARQTVRAEISSAANAMQRGY